MRYVVERFKYGFRIVDVETREAVHHFATHMYHDETRVLANANRLADKLNRSAD